MSLGGQVNCRLIEDRNIQITGELLCWLCGYFDSLGLGSLECLKSSFNVKPLTEKEIRGYGCELKQINATSAVDAWNIAVEQLQSFRQGADIGRKHKEDHNGQKKYYNGNKHAPELGQSFWPEADSISRITTKEGHQIQHTNAIESFPRAAFGLPIIFDFNAKPSKGEPPKTELSITGQEERMASPLILKAMNTGNNTYKAIALLLPHSHLDILSVTLKYSNISKYKDQAIKEGIRNINNKNNLSQQAKRQKIEDFKEEINELDNKLPKEFLRNGDNQWWNEDKKEYVEPIKDNNGTDALTAFMAFFTEGNN